jgi:hypothetical protein
MPGEPPSTRTLAHAWLAAVRDHGLAGETAMALVAPDFRLNLPRTLAPLLDGAALDTPPGRLAEVDAALRTHLDLAACEITRVDYDVFQGDRGGAQAQVRVRTLKGRTLDTVAAATFQRAGDKLCAVWVHADTVDLLRALGA